MTERIRIVVTGMGAITPLGLDLPSSWGALIEGKSGINLIEPPELRDSRVWIAGQVEGFDPTKYFTTRELNITSRCVQFSVVATGEALADSGLYSDGKLRDADPDRISIIMGSAIGGFTHIAEIENIIKNHRKGDQGISPYSPFQLLLGATSTRPSIKFGITGPSFSVDAECASGLAAMTVAFDKLKLREADIVITGGAEAPIYRPIIGSFASPKALSTRNDAPTEASRPFDQGADGFVMSEGSTIIVLENLEHALGRGAKIYAEVLGYGDGSDASHHAIPSGKGTTRAIRLALAKTGISPDEVDYLNPHGASTKAGDGTELNAIKEALNGRFRGLISATKSSVGHMLGTAAAFEALVCVKAIETDIVPPTLNLRNPIAEADGLDLVPLVARHKVIDTALNNSLGLGGGCFSILFRKYPG